MAMMLENIVGAAAADADEELARSCEAEWDRVEEANDGAGPRLVLALLVLVPDLLAELWYVAWRDCCCCAAWCCGTVGL